MNTEVEHYYGHKHELRHVFLNILKEIGVISPACRKAGISKSTFYRWVKDDPEFEEEVMVAMEKAYKKHGDKMDKIPKQKRSYFFLATVG